MNRSWTGEKRCWPLQVQCLREGAWQGSEKGTGTAVLRFVMWTRLTSSYFILTSLTSSSCILYSCFVNFIHLSAHRMSFCFTPPRRAPPSTAVAPATTTNAKLVPWHRDQRQHHRHHRSAFSALMGEMERVWSQHDEKIKHPVESCMFYVVRTTQVPSAVIFWCNFFELWLCQVPEKQPDKPSAPVEASRSTYMRYNQLRSAGQSFRDTMEGYFLAFFFAFDLLSWLLVASWLHVASVAS